MAGKNLSNDNAFTRFYLRHSRDLFNFLYFKTGDTATANDLVQESFMKVFQNCHNIEESKSKSYLFTTANNLFLNVVKHHQVRRKFAAQQPAVAQTGEDPEFVLQEKEYREELRAAIAQLTDAQREVFLLNRIDGKKYREIAEMLSISEKAVEKRMMGALKKLRTLLEDF